MEDEMINKVMYTLSQKGFEDREIKVEFAKLYLMIELLNRVVSLYSGKKKIKEETEGMDVVFPKTEYTIPTVGKVNFFDLIYGELSYRKKVRYESLHSVMAKTINDLDQKIGKDFRDILNDAERRIYKLWKIIDRRYIENGWFSEIKGMINKVMSIVDSMISKKLPIKVVLSREFGDEMEEIKSIDSEKIKELIEVFRDALVLNLKMENMIKWEFIEIPILNALPRFPETYFEEGYIRVQKEMVKEFYEKLLNEIRGLMRYVQFMPNPNNLKVLVETLDESEMPLYKVLVYAYSKSFLSLNDKLYIMLSEFQEKVQELD
ncbi:MAG: hypothetical protein ACTSVF_04220 [Candidatus Asgardarchaeia archaeon]